MRENVRKIIFNKIQCQGHLLNDQNKIFQSEKNTYIQGLKFVFSYSQDEWECNLNLTYPPFKLNGLYEQLAPVK